MLRSFRVANHKSFRDEAELLLLPTYDKSRSVTPVAAVFGANASGKSNLLDALRWMQTAVRESYARWEPGAGVPRTPFRLDPVASAEPSMYCVEIIVDGLRYTYGLELDDERVLEEWLYTYPHNRRRIIFERDRNGIRLGSTVPDYRSLGEPLARQTRDNALFLGVAAHNALAEVQPIYQWFHTALRFVDGGELAEDELARRLRDDDQRSALVELIGAADLGITDIIDNDEAMAALDARVMEELRAGLLRDHVKAALHDRELLASVVVDASPDKIEALLEDQTSREKLVDEVSEHLLASGTFTESVLEKVRERNPIDLQGRLSFRHGVSSVLLSLDDQSAGTRSWIGLVSAALSALDGGGLMVVDEVDASLHPHVTARLINLFRDPKTNPDAAQLLLTTHDATLLDEETLSRDEIWFVEKEQESGATRLFPLTDFHPRKNENTEGRYLAGSYGAVPVLSEYRFRKALRGGGARDAAA